jgi:anti-anti-sigma regulatory factor
MKCHIIEKRDFAVAKISGPTDKKAPFLIKSIVHAEFNGKQPKLILDVENLDDSINITTQLAVIAAFKKEMDLMNGFLKICSLRPRIKNYLIKNRMDKIFDTYEDLNSAEKSTWERKEYGEKRRDTGAAA